MQRKCVDGVDNEDVDIFVTLITISDSDKTFCKSKCNCIYSLCPTGPYVLFPLSWLNPTWPLGSIGKGTFLLELGFESSSYSWAKVKRHGQLHLPPIFRCQYVQHIYIIVIIFGCHAYQNLLAIFKLRNYCPFTCSSLCNI